MSASDEVDDALTHLARTAQQLVKGICHPIESPSAIGFVLVHEDHITDLHMAVIAWETALAQYLGTETTKETEPCEPPTSTG